MLVEGSCLMYYYPKNTAVLFCFRVIFTIKLWCVLSYPFGFDLFLQRRRMLFMASLCRGISLKFLCTSLVWGRWVTLALFDDIILLLKPFLLADWLTSACATEPRHYTLTLPTYWQTHTYCFPLGIFQEGFGLFIPALSTHSHFSPASSVFPTEVYK